METRKHVHDIKQNSHGMTKLLVAIPMGQRIGLAQVSTETSIAQQELIRMAIGSLLAEHGIDGDTQRQHARPTPVSQLTNTVRPEFCCSEFVIAIIEHVCCRHGQQMGALRGRPIG